MNKEKANKVLEVYGKPGFKVKGSNRVITFARQDISDVERIEKLSDEDLIQEWKGLVFLNHIYGQVSLGELQRIDLIELEFDNRASISKRMKELKSWYDMTRKEFKLQEEKGLIK